jgi:hypothetical protein
LHLAVTIARAEAWIALPAEDRFLMRDHLDWLEVFICVGQKTTAPKTNPVSRGGHHGSTFSSGTLSRHL